MPDFSLKLYELSIMALPFLFAVTMREALRGFVAHKLGDPTVAMSGRLSFNPLNHADPIWTGVVPIVAFVFLNLPILLGQAKPIDINPQYFKNLKRDLLLMALSGPVSLIVLSLLWAYVVRIAYAFGFTPADWLVQTGHAGIFLSCIFLVISLLPIPPLDGGKVLEYFLPDDAAEGLRTIEPYGFFVIIGLFIFVPGIIVVPSQFLYSLVLSITGL
ncbi:site-2 protease family protein [Kordiimonas pumila]|uniref:Site-2 protease family protein n=1 Tax=Kordiimonas pumila TaxID=2161677 RepID=A0ABV7D2C8_9PROT|nr:site-2 protease family protein [Kordiimonas pumila]